MDSIENVTNQLDVLDKYQALLKESLGSNSVYIRAKETINELAANGDLTDAQTAEIISQVLTGLNNSLVNASMSTAMQWASGEKDVALKKLELAKQLDILDQDKLLKEAQIEKIGYDSIATQAQTKKVYGTPVVVDGVVTGLADDGKTTQEIELLSKEIINKTKEGELLDKKKRESDAAVHKVVSDTYWNYGTHSFDLTETGVSNVAATHGSAWTPLSSHQAVIAKEQANGYAYNAWANALTGAASFLATGIASEADIFATSTSSGSIAADVVLGAAQRLITADAPFNTQEDSITTGE